jgi:hypothetical protein
MKAIQEASALVAPQLRQRDDTVEALAHDMALQSARGGTGGTALHIADMVRGADGEAFECAVAESQGVQMFDRIDQVVEVRAGHSRGAADQPRLLTE